MAGAKDLKKRAVVRKLLKLKRGQQMSDREAAAECDCSRALVKAVRLEMIAAAEHPAVSEDPWTGRSMYKAGGSVRGGYVYDDQGQVVREKVWERRRRTKAPQG
jgi:hypothetical protein